MTDQKKPLYLGSNRGHYKCFPLIGRGPLCTIVQGLCEGPIRRDMGLGEGG